MSFRLFLISYLISICISNSLWAMPVKFGSSEETKIGSSGEFSHAQQSFFEVYEFRNPMSQMPDFSQPGQSLHPNATETVTGRFEASTQYQSSIPSVPTGAEIGSSVPFPFSQGPSGPQAPTQPHNTKPHAPAPQAPSSFNLSHLAPPPKIQLDPLANFSTPSAPIPSFQFPTAAPLFGGFNIGIDQSAISQGASILSASLNFDLDKALDQRFAAMAEEDEKMHAFRRELPAKQEEGLRQIANHYEAQREKMLQDSTKLLENYQNHISSQRADMDALLREAELARQARAAARARETSTQQWAENNLAEVQKKSEQATKLLDRPQVVDQFKHDPEIRTSILAEIEQSQDLAQQAVELASTPQNESMAKYLGNVACKTLESTNRFLLGVYLGTTRGVQDAAQAISAIYHDPSLVGAIADGLIDVATTLRDLQLGDPEAWGKVKDAVWDFSVKFYLASAQEKGEIVGEFAADFMIATITEGVGGKILQLAKGVAKRAAKAGITHEVGQQLLTKIEENAALRTGLGPTQAEAQIAAQGISDSARVAITTTLEENILEVTATTARGEISIMAERIIEGERMILRGLHAQGSGLNTLGPGELIRIGREIGRNAGVREIVIEGGLRSTGAGPGRIPRPFTIRID